MVDLFAPDYIPGAGVEDDEPIFPKAQIDPIEYVDDLAG